jgi:hypothetical protein
VDVTGGQRAAPILEDDRQLWPSRSSGLVESKLRSPLARPGIVVRRTLVDRRDNDPVVRLSYIATALAAPGVSVAATAVPRLLATAELRLLPLLAAHLTLAEIGQRLQEIGLLGV